MKVIRGRNECGNPCNPHLGDEVEVIVWVADKDKGHELRVGEGTGWVVLATVLDDLGDYWEEPCWVRAGGYELEVMSDWASSWVNPSGVCYSDDPLAAWVLANGRPLERHPAIGDEVEVHLPWDTHKGKVKLADHINARRRVEITTWVPCRRDETGRWVLDVEQ